MKSAFRLVVLVLLVLALSTAISISAQRNVSIPDATETIAVGDEITGDLGEGTPIVTYAFEGAAGDIVGIAVQFDDIDGYLLLADEDGTIIAENDDADSLFRSKIPAFELPEDGTYLIAVSTYGYVRSQDPSDEGSFTLAVSAPEVEPVAVGDEIESELSEETPIGLYFVEAEAGQLLVVAVESEDFDTQLYLDPASGQDARQLWNDDYGDGTNSQIGPTLISESGRYVISVSSFFDDELGSYTLTVSEAAATPVEAGEAVRGEITLDATEHFFAFEAEEGQELQIAVQAVQTIDLVLDLYDPTGNLVGYNDDSDDLNPAIDYEVMESGTYLIKVYSAAFFIDENDLGEFDLTVTVES